MPTTKVIKPKQVEATGKPQNCKSTAAKTKAEERRSGADAELTAPAVRQSRASSCPRCPQPRGRCDRAVTGAQGRVRATSAAPRAAPRCPRANPDYPRATASLRHPTVNHPQSLETTACPGERERERERERRSQSHKAFTVIPPNPKKRREMQRKAEAELAALEELRLSRAMAYVSINPSSVGGCLSLEEVRLKQQQEMMQAKRKQKPV